MTVRHALKWWPCIFSVPTFARASQKPDLFAVEKSKIELLHQHHGGTPCVQMVASSKFMPELNATSS
eukprot:CAMPEP_0172681724 /NCGR_PEP_ID=MMETSP1074-20121228/17667_1 /TAXON_ID=2916 /ORGANISM="Ceratium fusus, Strain PA161109" /LENGTH=66 /DNA_ID=CAMNT_0013500277 /DNA_START=41 /DNA_END=237 /DNA_ORIENTATION=+